MTFNEAVEEMKKLAEGKAWSLQYEAASYFSKPCWIHGYIASSDIDLGHAEGATTYAEAIENVKRMLNPPVPDSAPKDSEWLRANKPLICAKCGYNKSTCAIEGHHLNPQQKERKEDSFGWWVQSAPSNFLKKILSVNIAFLCANCHKELHFGLWNIKEMEVNNE